MKFLLFNIVTGTALVYLVLSGTPRTTLDSAEAPTPKRPTAAAATVEIPVAEIPVAEIPVAEIPVAEIPVAPDVPRTAVSEAEVSVPVSVPPVSPPGALPAAEPDIVGRPRPPMMSAAERSRMLRDLARDMETRFLEVN